MPRHLVLRYLQEKTASVEERQRWSLGNGGRTSFISSWTGDSSDRNPSATRSSFEYTRISVRVDETFILGLLNDWRWIRFRSVLDLTFIETEDELFNETRSFTEPNGFINSHLPYRVSESPDRSVAAVGWWVEWYLRTNQYFDSEQGTQGFNSNQRCISWYKTSSASHSEAQPSL